MKKSSFYFVFLLLGMLSLPGLAAAAGDAKEEGGAQVLRAFADSQDKDAQVAPIEDRTKRQIMFLMGIPLLLLLIATGAFGIATGVYGKQLFVAHMICAGLSLTLALAHAIVGVVWFYPF